MLGDLRLYREDLRNLSGHSIRCKGTVSQWFGSSAPEPHHESRLTSILILPAFDHNCHSYELFDRTSCTIVGVSVFDPFLSNASVVPRRRRSR